MSEPKTITPVGITSQREVDALFSEAKHFTPQNIHLVKVSTGITLEYAVHTKQVDGAQDEERVLLLMGFGETKEAWAPVVDLLHENWGKAGKTKNLTIVTFDNRGSGGSTADWGLYSTSSLAADSLALMDHLGWAKAHMIGLSMGGMIALELATTAPQRLDSLSLIVTTRGGFDTSGASHFIFKSMMARDQDTMLQMTLDFFYPKDFLAKPLEGSTETTGDVLRRLHKAKLERPQQGLAGFLGHTLAIRTHFVSDERLATLGLLGIPIMVMGCTGDQLIPSVESLKIRDAIGADHVRFVYYDNAAHCVVLQSPDEVCQQLLVTIEAAK